MKPYVPKPLPITSINYSKHIKLIGQANAALARYDGLLESIPSPAVLLSPLTTREAVLSSKIEGTQATVDQVLEQEAGIEHVGELGKDIDEIKNYRRALMISQEYLKESPIRLSFVRMLHETLMEGVRGRDKSPGQFRREQNWIGKFGCSIDEASFVPPAPFQLQDHLEDWERYLDDDREDILVQTAIAHAQFELLHPFKDGNGRIGRLLIPLFLFHKGALTYPMFYLSEYLEANRSEYYERLGSISKNDDWDGWVEFFLRAIVKQATINTNRTTSIRVLYDEMKARISEITRSQFAIHIVDKVFSKPIFRVSDLSKQLSQETGASEKTLSAIFRQLRAEGILRELQAASGRRSAVMSFPELLARAEK